MASLWREATRSLHSPAALFSGENLRWDGWSIRLGDSLDESTELTTSPRGLWAIIDQDSLHNLYFCISSKINVANLFKEMEAATPIGALDEVFTQYCEWVFLTNFFNKLLCCKKHSFPVLIKTRKNIFALPEIKLIFHWIESFFDGVFQCKLALKKIKQDVP